MKSEWSHVGMIYKPNINAPKDFLPEHTCQLTNDYSFHIDTNGNIFYSWNQQQQILKSNHETEKNSDIYTNHRRKKIVFDNHTMCIESEITSKKEEMGYKERNNNDDDDDDDETIPTFQKHDLTILNMKKHVQKRININIKTNFLDKGRLPCPWYDAFCSTPTLKCCGI